MRNKILSSILIPLTLIIIINTFVFLPISNKVYAGKTGYNIVDDTVLWPSGTGTQASSNDKLSASEWSFIDNKGISLKTTSPRKIHFGDEYNIRNPFLARTPIVSTEVSTGMVANIEFKLNFSVLSQNKKFGFSFGISRLDSDVGIKNSSFLYFSNDKGSYKIGLVYYDDTNKEITIVDETDIANLIGTDTSVQIILYTDGKVDLYINDNYYKAKQTVNPLGYFGFVSSGSFTSLKDGIKINADLLHINVFNEYYAQPATPKIAKADFTNNEFNSEEFIVKGQNVYVTNDELHFNNAKGNTMITTRHAYSNFELNYSIFDVLNEPYDDPKAMNGRRAPSYWHSVAFGYDKMPVEDIYYGLAYDYGYFVNFDAPINGTTLERSGPTTVSLVHKKRWLVTTTLPSKFDFLSPSFDKDLKVNIKIRVVDGQFEILMKLETENIYTSIVKRTLEGNYSPPGYVSICGESNSRNTSALFSRDSNYKLDDVSVINYDAYPSFITTEYKSSKPKTVYDFKYIDTWNKSDLIGERLSGIGNNVKTLASVSLFIVVSSLCFKFVKRGK